MSKRTCVICTRISWQVMQHRASNALVHLKHLGGLAAHAADCLVRCWPSESPARSPATQVGSAGARTHDHLNMPEAACGWSQSHTLDVRGKACTCSVAGMQLCMPALEACKCAGCTPAAPHALAQPAQQADLTAESVDTEGLPDLGGRQASQGRTMRSQPGRKTVHR